MDRLCDLAPGQSGRVRGLVTAGPMRRRLQELGLVEGTLVRCAFLSPGGDPAAYALRGSLIALRRGDRAGVLPGAEQP